MIQTIDMQKMRYINLFRKICKVSTINCFNYNNAIVFAVPKAKVSMAIGPHGDNMKKLGMVLRKRIKVISMPKDDSGMQKFVEDVVNPITFTKFEIKDGQIVISGGRQSKAALIGRNRTREAELKDILSKTFKVGLRIS